MFLCVDYKNTDKETVFWSPAYNAYSSKALSLGYRYVVSFDGRYLMSIREKYIPTDPGKPIEEFDITSWWYKTTLFTMDHIKEEMSDDFNNIFGKFLVWCEIVPYFR